MTSRLARAAAVLLMATAPLACSGNSNPADVASPTPSRITMEVGHVRLVPVWPTVSRYCRLAAAKTGLAVPCPTIAPAAKHPRAVWQLCRGTDRKLEGRGCSRRGFGLEEIFRGRAGYRGLPGPDGRPTVTGHLAVWATPGTEPITPTSAAGCPSPRRLEQETVGRITGHWYECKSGFADLNSGHVMFTWTDGHATVGVGMHGHTGANRLLIKQIVANLTIVVAG